MHGNKSQNQRRRALASFESGDCQTLVATDVAARGIDVADITHVINFDAPADRDAYVHRTGRTGRAGATGVAASFVLPDQRRDMGKIAAELGLNEEFGVANGGGHRGGANGSNGSSNGGRDSHLGRSERKAGGQRPRRNNRNRGGRRGKARA